MGDLGDGTSPEFVLTPFGEMDSHSHSVHGGSQMGLRTATTRLAQLTPGRRARIRTIQLDPRERDWLRAVGLFEGQTITVLRRGVFGGPLHVRTASGGELAIDRRLALHIDIEGLADGDGVTV